MAWDASVWRGNSWEHVGQVNGEEDDDKEDNDGEGGEEVNEGEIEWM